MILPVVPLGRRLFSESGSKAARKQERAGALLPRESRRSFPDALCPGYDLRMEKIGLGTGRFLACTASLETQDYGRDAVRPGDVNASMYVMRASRQVLLIGMTIIGPRHFGKDSVTSCVWGALHAGHFLFRHPRAETRA